MNPYKNPKITLVGAGPGDPELLTIKGLKAIQTADVILYDALVNPELLNHSSEDCLTIFVGKRVNNHRFTQTEINIMLVEFAQSHGHVVRLKGGDSFVFGRGHEEITYVEKFGIETEIVPGISSCISLPELQKVPVTRRGLNESFWVLTGTTRSGKLSEDIAVAAQSSATAVILMGMRKLREIATIFSIYGKGETPVLVIQNGSLRNEKKVLGTVDTIANIVEMEGLSHPGIIIIGEVVSLHPEFSKEMESLQNVEFSYSQFSQTLNL